MAICRFGENSDVYVFDAGGHWECCRCDLLRGDNFMVPTAAKMIEHLQEHRGAGHKVPAAAFEELARESDR